MKYKDRNITIQADKILFFDIDRPFPALIDFFNPKTNQIVAGGRDSYIGVGLFLEICQRRQRSQFVIQHFTVRYRH